VDAAALASELAEFLRQRLGSLLEESGLDGDLVQAVAGPDVPLARVLGDPEDARRRAALPAVPASGRFGLCISLQRLCEIPAADRRRIGNDIPCLA
jgi:glycyl-tRNA synthetase beta subunit